MMFSVVIPLYNKEHTIERAIRSVLNQTVQDSEVVVVDDGSTDGGRHIVERIGDPRVRLIHQENQGVSAARNRGIAEARFDFVAFLDADDEWMPTFLETIVRLVGSFPQAAVYATNYLLSDADGKAHAAVLRGLSDDSWEGVLSDYFAIAARSDSPVCSSAVTVRRDAITSIGGFPAGVKDGEDLLTWARLAVYNEIAYSCRPCAVFWRPQKLDDRPERNDYSNDTVGQALWALMETVESAAKPSLRDYIFRWYKSTSSILLQLGRRRMARREICQALRCRRLSIKIWLYFLCSLMPLGASKWSVRQMLMLSRAFHKSAKYTR